ALQAVVPLMVRADQLFLVARTLATELHAAMRTDVFNDVDATLEVARHDHRALADDRALEVARLGYLSLQAHIAPVVVIEKTLELFLVKGLVGVCPEGNTARALALPHRVFRENCRHVAHES